MVRLNRTLLIFGILSLSLIASSGFAHGNSSKSKQRRSSSSSARYIPFCNGRVAPTYAQADNSEVAKKCSAADKQGDVRTVTCIEWVATQAEKAFSKDPSCANKVTAPLMMCIFKKEVTWYGNNPCGRNGCGLSQMTSAGVSTVKRGLSTGGLFDEYDYFWDLVGRPEEKENKCFLTRKSAMDRDTAVVMAATHLCAEAKAKKNDSAYVLARDYNGSSTKNAYARSVESCLKRDSWKSDPVRQQQRVGVKAQCRRYKTCGGKALSRRHSKRKIEHQVKSWTDGII